MGGCWGAGARWLRLVRALPDAEIGTRDGVLGWLRDPTSPAGWGRFVGQVVARVDA
jgi:hypothetical protein